MKKLVLFALVLFLIGSVSAICDSGGIDINSAKAEELDKITWVGPATATKIIAARPFDSVDNLIEVSGIGEVKLADIKAEGLACVEEVISGGDEETNYTATKTSEERDNILNPVTQNVVNEEPKLLTFETINLNPKDIKSEGSSEKLENENNYALYGLGIFSIVLAILFVVRFARKNKYKSEFI